MDLRSFACLFILGCYALGLPAQVGVVGSKKLSLEINGNQLVIPYFSNGVIEPTAERYTKAVIVVHGTNRNADEYFDNMMFATALRPAATENSLIIAPQFLIQDDLTANALDQRHLYWSSGGWRSGSLSRDDAPNRRPVRISSYAVLDTLLFKVIQNHPEIESIVFTGHSAGGQLTNRFAASSTTADRLCSEQGISTKFIVANPSSYVYMDEKRIASGTSDVFRVPTANCPGYNEWRYGLDDLFSYPSMAGKDSIRAMMKRREVVYLLGENDDNSASSSLDVSCEGRLQGVHRLNRGTIYFRHLIDYFGSEIAAMQSLDTVPNAGHNNFDMYTSEIGLFHLFEETPTSCKVSGVVNTNEWIAGNLTVFPNPTSGILNIKGLTEKGSLLIYDLMGRVVFEKEFFDLETTQIDITNLEKGSYFLKYQMERRVYTAYIIKTSSF